MALWETDWDLKLHPDSEFQIQALPEEDKADPEAAGQWGDPLQVTQAWPVIIGAHCIHFGSLD